MVGQSSASRRSAVKKASKWFIEHFAINAPVAVAAAPATKQSASASAAKALSIDEAAEKISIELLAVATAEQLKGLKAHFVSSNSVPPDFDRRLIAKTAVTLAGRKFSGDEMRQIRGVFVKTVRSTK